MYNQGVEVDFHIKWYKSTDKNHPCKIDLQEKGAQKLTRTYCNLSRVQVLASPGLGCAWPIADPNCLSNMILGRRLCTFTYMSPHWKSKSQNWEKLLKIERRIQLYNRQRVGFQLESAFIFPSIIALAPSCFLFDIS